MDVFVAKQVVKNFVLPPTGPVLISLLGVGLAATVRWRSTGATLCLVGLVLLWVLSTPVTADALLRWTEAYPALDLRRPVKAQAIVILAGGARVEAPEYHGPAPGAATLERLVYGARVAKATGLPVLVSGSHYEAEAMTNFLQRDLNVTPQWIENRSRDTYWNARLSAAILQRAQVHKIVLVTSAAHMARSVAEFKDAGLEVIPAPAAMWSRREWGILAFVPNADALVRSQRALYEVLGLWVHSLRDWLTAVGLLHPGPVPAPPPAPEG
jgi:uncharacterized SAM-binding protein YcdF (DUF218 family)